MKVSRPSEDYAHADMQVRVVDPYAAAKYDLIIRQLARREPLDILNAGCGSGTLSFLLARHGHRVLGIDIVPDYVEAARTTARATGLTDCRFEVGTIERLPLDRVFDVVVAADVIEHIADDRAAVARLSRVLRPGGRLILTVPAGTWLLGYHDEALGHFRRYSRGSLRQLVEPHVRVNSVRYFGASLVPVCFLYSRVLRRPYPIAAVGDEARHPAIASLVRQIFALEGRVSPPFGTGLVLSATRDTAGA